MSALEPVAAAIGAEGGAWVGLAAAGWLMALMIALVAIWQAARADRLGVRAAEAAHELRGPLCAARLALHRLERVFGDVPSVAPSLTAMDLELHRAGLALEELGSLGAGGGLRIAPRRVRGLVDLGALAAAAEPSWRALAEACDTTVAMRTNGGPALALGDERRIASGIANLVANACEHGRGPVIVTIVGDGGQARVEVSDGGGGPSVEVLRRARRRAQARWPRIGPAASRGHGMAVAARVAHEGGGRLRARRTATGVVVSLELPSAPLRTCGRSGRAAAMRRWTRREAAYERPETVGPPVLGAR